ncbi:choline dehydrogenase [Colletotrichum musicola]|uniref:Choline dehydrogenase n=1 Tax=Colletotrichum musicola TaxID=2175873 RepID=A0A8H6JZG7_9PEZI|nr:choline dehydrogenase [Colletotrichum musicola]
MALISRLVQTSLVVAATVAALSISPDNNTYDYIIAGGGTAGMVLASRLSANPAHSVLVVESGMPDNYEEAVMIPRFYPGATGFAPGTPYDWNLTTVPQDNLQGRTVNLTQGHAVGGSSTINAMIFDRGMPSNYDAWAALGNEGWDYQGLLPYFKKSETFTPAPADHVSLYGLTYDSECHGFEGPVKSSYLSWSHPNNTNFLEAMHNLGISSPVDQACNPLGAYLTTHAVDAKNQSRSSARTSYYDHSVGRANLNIFVGHRVTKLVLAKVDGKVVAKGIELAEGPNSSTQTIIAGREVIVSAGALNSPKLLQLSGIGPSSVLSKHGIETSVDLPGVGANLQDHLYGITLASLHDGIPGNADLDNATFDADQRDLYYAERKGRWTDTIAEALAFIPLANFTSTDVSENLLSTINSTATDFLPQGLDLTVIAGYEKQVSQILSMHSKSSTAAMELLYLDGGRTIANILMHPLSRGTVSIASSDPFAQPEVDPRYLSHPYDSRVLVESLRFNRKLIAAGPVQALGATETLPGAAVESDADVLAFVKSVASTEIHYSGTCAMLPRELGGVVDSELEVYGVEGLRVVDASIMPLLPSAHTQATVYAIAEKAADIILATHD